jgi:hypothetical protein
MCLPHPDMKMTQMDIYGTALWLVSLGGLMYQPVRAADVTHRMIVPGINVRGDLWLNT